MTTEHTPGPYIAHGSAIYANTPQDVDHSMFKGFDTKEPHGVGYLIAESIPHVPTRDLLAAAPDLLEALEGISKVLRADCGIEPCIQSHAPAEHYLALAVRAIQKAHGQPA